MVFVTLRFEDEVVRLEEDNGNDAGPLSSCAMSSCIEKRNLRHMTAGDHYGGNLITPPSLLARPL